MTRVHGSPDRHSEPLYAVRFSGLDHPSAGRTKNCLADKTEFHTKSATPTLDSLFEGLADYVVQHFQPGVLQSLIAH